MATDEETISGPTDRHDGAPFDESSSRGFGPSLAPRVREVLRAYREGALDEDDAIQRLVRFPFEHQLLGRLDHNREERTGIPEVVLCEGKDAAEVVAILEEYQDHDEQLIATRLTPSVFDAIEMCGDLGNRIFLESEARIAAVRPPDPDTTRPNVVVVSAGTSDRPVAREALVTSRLLGNPTDFIEDVGVAGLSRLAPELPRLDEAGILIVVAGMDGALPSLVGGMARQPVIAVPTSAGYGTAFGGVSALLTMLNSCVPGTAVMNIDNGFGAAVLATKINFLVDSFQ